LICDGKVGPNRVVESWVAGIVSLLAAQKLYLRQLTKDAISFYGVVAFFVDNYY
jgi:hypothetical protein